MKKLRFKIVQLVAMVGLLIAGVGVSVALASNGNGPPTFRTARFVMAITLFGVIGSGSADRVRAADHRGDEWRRCGIRR